MAIKIERELRAERMLRLMRLLSRRKWWALAELQEAVGGRGAKTLRRDLALLRRAGQPLESKVAAHGRKHWRLKAKKGG